MRLLAVYTEPKSIVHSLSVLDGGVIIRSIEPVFMVYETLGPHIQPIKVTKGAKSHVPAVAPEGPVQLSPRGRADAVYAEMSVVAGLRYRAG